MRWAVEFAITTSKAMERLAMGSTNSGAFAIRRLRLVLLGLFFAGCFSGRSAGRLLGLVVDSQCDRTRGKRDANACWCLQMAHAKQLSMLICIWLLRLERPNSRVLSSSEELLLHVLVRTSTVAGRSAEILLALPASSSSTGIGPEELAI